MHREVWRGSEKPINIERNHAITISVARVRDSNITSLSLSH